MCQKMLVPSDLLDKPWRIGGIKLDPEVEGDRHDAPDLSAHSLARINPVLQNKIDRLKIDVFNKKFGT